MNAPAAATTAVSASISGSEAGAAATKMLRRPLHLYTVLLVDDEPAVLRALERVFMLEPCKVLSTTSARQAIGMAREHQPDVVISDIRMPELSGPRCWPPSKKWPRSAPA